MGERSMAAPGRKQHPFGAGNGGAGPRGCAYVNVGVRARERVNV